jgi:hypothetical protein
MQGADLRLKSSSPTAPGAGIVNLYADASGILKVINSAGTVQTVAGYNNAAISGILQSVAAAYTGGTTYAEVGGTGAVPTGYIGSSSGVFLGLPTIFISIIGSGGVTYGIPAYTLA